MSNVQRPNESEVNVQRPTSKVQSPDTLNLEHRTFLDDEFQRWNDGKQFRVQSIDCGFLVGHWTLDIGLF
jgi:hypothetical protein